MTYANNFAPGVVASPLEDSPTSRTPRRERNANVGYILFAFGAFWVVAVAAMAAAPASSPVSAAPPGLDVSAIAIPAGLPGTTYDAF